MTTISEDYLTQLEGLRQKEHIDEKTVDFFEKIAALDFDARGRIHAAVRPEGLDPSALADKLARGETLFQADVISAHPDILHGHLTAVLDLFDTLKSDRLPEARKLAAAFAADDISITSLMGHVYRQDEGVLSSIAERLAIPIELLIFCVFTVARPLFAAYAAHFRALVSFEPWSGHTCPVCGSIPCMARLLREDGRRRLSCQLCGAEWTFDRLRCAFCNTANREALEVMTVDQTPYRIDACKECKSYIKTVDERHIEDESYRFLAAIEDLATIHIDLIAEQEGYSKPVFMPRQQAEQNPS